MPTPMAWPQSIRQAQNIRPVLITGQPHAVVTARVSVDGLAYPSVFQKMST